MSDKLTRQVIETAYLDILLRRPDPTGIETYLKSDFSYFELVDRLASSKEYEENILPLLSKVQESNRPRILLFGAYGNGNLGDDIQAASVEALVNLAVPNASVWATSLFSERYPGCETRQLPVGAIYSNEILKLFDVLLIGGGGLLAHPHEPLGDAAWCKRLPIPAAFVGIGAEGPFVATAAPLLERAAVIGVRDVASLAAVIPFTPIATLIPDPVLVSPVPMPPNSAVPKRYNTCWIVRNPVDRHVEGIRDRATEEDVILGLEPIADSTLLSLFPNIRLIKGVREFWQFARASRRIVSMRYHGVVLGLKAGVETYSFRVTKGSSLLRLLGLNDRIIRDVNAFQISSVHDQDCVAEQLKEFTELYVAHLRGIMNQVVAAESRSGG